LREQAGLSQQQVADKLGMTQAAYAWWERNTVALRPEQLQALATALNVSTDELVGHPSRSNRKSGPPSQLERRIEALRQLPREKQRFVIQLLDTVLRENQQKAG
jgi:transcriptional regulator with XRE-family HTH domain